MKSVLEPMSSKHGRIDEPQNEAVREVRKKYRHLFVVILLGLLCNPLFADEKPQYDVAAFYWPSLHHDARWAEFFPGGGADGEWESIRNCMPKWEGHWQPRVPAWGYLHDNDPKAMEKKIDAATSHGVNVMIYDWYWFDNKPFLESARNDGFLKAKNVDQMKFYLMWANHDANTAWDIRRSHQMETIWPGSVDFPTFKTVVARVIEKYFSHPSYYKIDGKPVFSIYDINNLVKGLGGVQQAVEALDYFRAEVKKVKGTAGNRAQVGVRVYSSKDLCNWKDEGVALQVSDDPKSDIAKDCILERPKVIYNAKTGKFVMWFHLELKGHGYRSARSGIAISDKPAGPFKFVRSIRPNAGHWPQNVTEAQKDKASRSISSAAWASR